MCAYLVVPTAVTGDIVPAAWGNRVRDNSAYLKGQAGAVTIENALSATGAISTSAGIISTAGPANQFLWTDRTTSEQWVLYATGGYARLYTPALADLMLWHVNGTFSVRDHVANGGAGAHTGLYPGWLSQSALTGFLRAGQWTYAYNGDGTIASQVMNAAGPLSGWALTYEYSGGLVSAMRLRTGGAGGTIVQSIGYTYDGTGRIATETHS